MGPDPAPCFHYRSVRAASPVGKRSKLAVDFAPGAWLCQSRKAWAMDYKDLIGRLCVTAGMIMEDASVGAILDGPGQHERVAGLLRASEAIKAVSEAAEALNRYCDSKR